MRRIARQLRVPAGQRYKVLDPVLAVDPGETIVFETINHMTPIVASERDLCAHGSPGYREREETGPLYVRGAQPGDTLAIHIVGIEVVGLPHAHGWGPLADIYPQRPLAFPVHGQRVLLPGSVSLPLAPMIGDIYTTPAAPEPPFPDHGGNMDFAGVRPGSTLYLPVYHEGGLLVLGDVHALQGDGELYGEGAETAADVTVSIDISRQLRCQRPALESERELTCLASRESLYEGIQLATQDMVALLSQRYGLAQADAYVLCTLAGSLRLGGSLSRREWAEKWLWVGLGVDKDVRVGAG